MTEQHAGKSRQRKKEDDASESPDQSGKADKAKEVSAVTEDVLDDIDRVLKAQCGFDEDEIINEDEFAKRAEIVVNNYQQKGGQ